MIITNDADKLFIPTKLDSVTTSVWRRAWLELAIPYYFVSYQLNDADTGRWWRQTALLSDLGDLLALCKLIKFGKGMYKSLQILLIAPSWMAQGDGWAMINLREIWSVVHKDADQTGIIFIADDGRKYMESNAANDASSEIKAKEVIFSTEF